MRKIVSSIAFAYAVLVANVVHAEMIEIGSDPSRGARLSINQATETVQYDEAGYLTLGYVTQYVETGKSVIINRSSVRISDCIAGMGFLYVRNMNNYFQFKGDWVSGGSSVSSVAATRFCEIAKNKKLY